VHRLPEVLRVVVIAGREVQELTVLLGPVPHPAVGRAGEVDAQEEAVGQDKLVGRDGSGPDEQDGILSVQCNDLEVVPA
jgi:hypothetical protein